MAEHPGSGNAQVDSSSFIRVLVVDDSAFMRQSITKYLNQVVGIQVIGTARNGMEALEMIPRLKPDVVTLDVEMPHLDGLSTLRKIMAAHPLPVIMVSSLTSDGAAETIQALTLGAIDFIAKPDNIASITEVMEDVANKVMRAAKARVVQLRRVPNPIPQSSSSQQSRKVTRALRQDDRIVVIGSSTGGPQALNAVLPALPANLPAAFLVVQHMPAGFTRSLAERLDTICALKVKEAEPGDRLEVGKVLLAPGGFHMVLDAQDQIALNKNPPVHGVRPAIDVTMNAVVKRFGRASISVILTGMGSDGTTGSALIHGVGGRVITEAESTCVVWGMPRSVAEAGLADVIAPLTEIAASIEREFRSY